MRTSFRLLAAVVAVGLVAGCGPTVGGDVAATVNGTDISRTILEESVRAMVGGNDDEMTAEERQTRASEFQREVLGFLIQDEIYAQVLADEGVEVTDADIEASRAAQVESLGGEADYEAQLQDFGVTVEVFETLVRLETRSAALQRHVLGEEEARAVRHILVESEDEATDLIDQLAEGADFGELAAEHSQDPGSADSGGAYPPAPRGSWVPEFEAAVWDAELNEVVGPVETMHGFHVIEVTEETALDPDEIAPEQLQQMTAAAVTEILQAAFQAAEVVVANGLGQWDPDSGRVLPEETDRVGEPRGDDPDPTQPEG